MYADIYEMVSMCGVERVSFFTKKYKRSLLFSSFNFLLEMFMLQFLSFEEEIGTLLVIVS